MFPARDGANPIALGIALGPNVEQRGMAHRDIQIAPDAKANRPDLRAEIEVFARLSRRRGMVLRMHFPPRVRDSFQDIAPNQHATSAARIHFDQS